MTRWDAYLEERRERHLVELFDYLRIPSISTLPEHAPDMERCARWVAGQLSGIGLKNVTLLPTDGNPVVWGEWLEAGPDAPTLLVYGHYDVQPADPLELWESPPFEPGIRDGRVYARGATDNKGPLFVYLKALETLLAVDGRLPCNVKLFVEGEEELRADHLEQFLQDERDRLRADALVISDAGMFAADTPSVSVSLRGMAALQLRVETAATDLHSGKYGGVAPNALHALTKLLGTLHDDEGRVIVDGFHDRVRPVPEADREEWQSLPFDPEILRQQIGASRLVGGDEHSPLERMWVRPTLDVHGIWGGFAGAGVKTVIPREAHAKLSCRLVPDQEPGDVLDLLARHLREHCPPEATLTIEWTLAGASPMTMPRDSPLVRVALDSLARGFGRDAMTFRNGASVPVAELVKRHLGLDALLLGFGVPTDGAHAPNEHFHLSNLERGIATMLDFFESTKKLAHS